MSGASSGASYGACLGHHLGYVWGISGTRSGACLGHVWGMSFLRFLHFHYLGHVWGIILGISGACLRHYLKAYLEQSKKSAVLHASLMPVFVADFVNICCNNILCFSSIIVCNMQKHAKTAY